MSTCKKIGVKVEVEVPGYQLSLSEDEAQFLRDLIGRHVVGDQNSSRRKYCDSIYHALCSVGLSQSGRGDMHGQVRCE